MADFAITPANVKTISQPLRSRIALVAIEKGESVYFDNNRVGLGDANSQTAGHARGIAVSKADAGSEVIIAIEDAIIDLGPVTGLNAGDPLFQSNTPGKLSPFADLIAGQWPCLVGWSLSINPVLMLVAPSWSNIQKAIG